MGNMLTSVPRPAPCDPTLTRYQRCATHSPITISHVARLVTHPGPGVKSVDLVKRVPLPNPIFGAARALLVMSIFTS